MELLKVEPNYSQKIQETLKNSNDKFSEVNMNE